MRRRLIEKPLPQSRDATIDALRGIAIVTMIAANLAAPLLLQPHPLWFRFYGSFAAPLFILLSGMMVAYTARAKGYGFRHFAVRGAMILAAGVLVDVLVWGIYPFTTVDVLYLIGVSMPLAYLLLRVKPPIQWTITIAFFLATPLLQMVLGYADFPTEISLLGQQTVIPGNQTNILSHWLVDGWFPVFPWLGFSFLGVVLAGVRWSLKSDLKLGRRDVILSGSAVLALGIAAWLLYPGGLLVREGYSELFYPPTIGYVLTGVGLVTLLFGLIERTASSRVYNPLRVMGESSLFIYVLHLAVIEYIISPFVSPQGIEVFLVIYAILLVASALIAYGLRTLKAKRRPKSYLVRFLIGGY